MVASELVDLQRTLYTSRNPTRRWLHCSRRDWIFGALRKYSPSTGGIALEVGPGSGVYLPVLGSLFERVVAADVEVTYLQALNPILGSLPNVSTAQDDITASHLPSGSFDLVLCSEVIEHITDSEKALSEIHRLLRPRGVLVLSTPQRYSPLELCGKIALLPGIVGLVRKIYQEPVLETGHINLLTAGRTRAQLGRAGFQIEEIYKSGMYLPLVAEFLGEAGLRCERWLESQVLGGPLDWLLWTQYYIARKA